jgi:hypothetical protein
MLAEARSFLSDIKKNIDDRYFFERTNYTGKMNEVQSFFDCSNNTTYFLTTEGWDYTFAKLKRQLTV